MTEKEIMKTPPESPMRTSFLTDGANLLSSIVAAVSMLFFFSCEIEDDFGKPDNSYNFGTLIYTAQFDGILKLFWNEQTNQIISIGNSIALIDAASKKSTQVNVSNFIYGGYDLSWVAGNTLYYVDNYGVLSSVNVTNGLRTVLADSVIQYDGGAMSPDYVAFAKWDKDDPNEPYVYFLNLKTSKEMLVTLGTPKAFSPDGQTLLFSRQNGNGRDFYIYSIPTKAITPLTLQDPTSYTSVIKWTSAGIMFYSQSYNGKTGVFNGSTNKALGEWGNTVQFIYGSISPSGRKIITYREECASKSSLPNCYTYFIQRYYVVDTTTGTEKEVIHGNNLYPTQFAFSPDENSLVYSMNTGIYLIQTLE